MVHNDSWRLRRVTSGNGRKRADIQKNKITVWKTKKSLVRNALEKNGISPKDVRYSQLEAQNKRSRRKIGNIKKYRYKS